MQSCKLYALLVTDVYSMQVVLGGAQEMYPAAITQKEKQLTRYKLNLTTGRPVKWDWKTTQK